MKYDVLKTGEVLKVNDYITAPNNKFYAIMQGDGHFCIYAGSGPADRREFIWGSGVYRPQGDFFARLERNGNFCVYAGTPKDNRGLVWASSGTKGEGDYFAAVTLAGNFTVYQGPFPPQSVSPSIVWQNITVNRSYDIAAGVTHKVLDDVAALFHEHKRDLFRGEKMQDGQTIFWDILKAPVFDLSPLNLAATTHCERMIARHANDAEAYTLLSAVGTPTNVFSIVCRDFTFRLQFDGEPPGEWNHLVVTAHCTMSAVTETRQIVLRANELTASATGDPFTDQMIQEQVLPRLRDVVNSLLSAVDVPKFELGGITFSQPIPFIAHGCLIATAFATLDMAGEPLSLNELPASTDLWTVFSPRVLQAAATLGIAAATAKSAIRGGASTGSFPFSAQYSYGIDFGTPELALDGDGLRATIPLKGGASATVTVVGVDVGISYRAYALPAPTAHFQLRIVDGNLWVTITSLDAFTILLEPSGGIAEWIISRAAWMIVQPIVAVATPIATRFIRDITFSVWQVPEVNIPVPGFALLLRPKDAVIRNAGGGLCISSGVEISKGNEAEPAITPAIAPPDLLQGDPCSIERCLYRNAAVGHHLTGGLYFGGAYKAMGNGVITELSPNALALVGSYNVDAKMMGEHLRGKGAFEARLALRADKRWDIRLKTDGDYSQNYQGVIDGAVRDGKCVFQGDLDVYGGVNVEITIAPTDGAEGQPSYVKAYAKLLGPQGQTLPTGYLKHVTP